MKTREDIGASIIRVLNAPGSNFVELAKIADLDPATDFRFANLSDVDFSGLDLDQFDFTGADLRGATFKSASILGATFVLTRELKQQLREAADGKEFLSRRRAVSTPSRQRIADKGHSNENSRGPRGKRSSDEEGSGQTFAVSDRSAGRIRRGAVSQQLVATASHHLAEGLKP